MERCSVDPGYILKWFTYPQTVTHPSTNPAAAKLATH